MSNHQMERAYSDFNWKDGHSALKIAGGSRRGCPLTDSCPLPIRPPLCYSLPTLESANLYVLEEVLMPRVVHFEIYADDVDRAIKFYSDTFG